jgi:hypothetical protein
MRDQKTNKARDEQQRIAVARWDSDGGAAPSDGTLTVEIEREQSAARDVRRAAFDTTHDSSVRGEHRYPDRHQTEAEQKAKHDRDVVKRKLGGTR